VSLAVRCTDHPAYAAKRKPSVNCQACWWIYNHVGKPAVVAPGRAFTDIFVGHRKKEAK
jgi:hypothetical protein